MHTRHRPSFFSSLFVLVALLSLLLVGCVSNGGSGSNSSTPGAGSLTNVSIAFGYIPDIQFAPLYVAQSKGYYKAAGLNADFHHGLVNDLTGSLAVGHVTSVFASGGEAVVT